MIKHTPLVKESRKRKKEEKEKSPAPSRIRTHDLQIKGRVLYRCSKLKTAAIEFFYLVVEISKQLLGDILSISFFNFRKIEQNVWPGKRSSKGRRIKSSNNLKMLLGLSGFASERIPPCIATLAIFPTFSQWTQKVSCSRDHGVDDTICFLGGSSSKPPTYNFFSSRVLSGKGRKCFHKNLKLFCDSALRKRNVVKKKHLCLDVYNRVAGLISTEY